MKTKVCICTLHVLERKRSNLRWSIFKSCKIIVFIVAGSLVKKLLETKKDLEGGSQHTPTKKVEIVSSVFYIIMNSIVINIIVSWQ